MLNRIRYVVLDSVPGIFRALLQINPNRLRRVMQFSF